MVAVNQPKGPSGIDRALVVAPSSARREPCKTSRQAIVQSAAVETRPLSQSMMALTGGGEMAKAMSISTCSPASVVKGSAANTSAPSISSVSSKAPASGALNT